MDAHDVKRACVRGGVVGAANAAALVVAASVPSLTATASCLGGDLALDRPLAALFGTFTGLLVVPAALVELHRASKPRSRARDALTALALFALVATLIPLASLQAIYTYEIFAGHAQTGALGRVLHEIDDSHAIAYALLCVAGAAPVAVVSHARMIGAGIALQVGCSVVAAIVSTTLAALTLQATAIAIDDVPVSALVLWLVGTAIFLPLLSALADRLAGRREV